jgi:transposase
MTIPGVDAMTALTVLAAVGDFHRLDSADKLVSYLGLNPRVRQSGGTPAHHGRITKAGCGKARGMLVQAAFAALRSPGPLRALHQGIAARRGMQIAIVALARKIAVIAWHLMTKEQDCAFARPSLVAFKRRKLELTAGAERRIARRGAGYDYNNKQLRRHEREIAEQAERAYAVLAAQWQPTRPNGRPRLPAIPGTGP